MRSRLDSDHVHRIRVTLYTDAYWSRALLMSRSAIRLARIGVTHPRHTTPPDCRPRLPGRRGDIAVIRPVPAPTVNLGRLIAGMRPPESP